MLVVKGKQVCLGQKLERKSASFCPIFFARFYRGIGVKIGFGDDLEIFSEWEGGGNQNIS